MIGGGRIGLFDDDEADFDVSGFQTKQPDEAKPRSAPAEVREIAEANRFVSREARQETVDAFYRIADENSWMIAETFERAVAALERERQSTASMAGKGT
jgi:hypothetical protein